MASHTITQSVATPSGTRDGTKSYTGTSSLEIEESIADSETDYDIVLAIDVSAVKSFYVKSDVAVTLETNAVDASGGNTLVLKAGVPYVWNTDSYDTFKLTADVTILYVTNASGSAAALQLYVIQDATP